MASSFSRLFSEADKSRIQAAVVEAEKKTSGEIVPYFVERSDDYEFAEWRGGALVGALIAAVFAGIHELTTIWLPFDFAGLVLLIMIAVAGGMLLVRFVHPLKRLLAGRTTMAHHVSKRAAEAFVAEEVFHTRDRTGILLFISFLEHQVLVLGDAGINAQVEKREWDDVVRRIVQGLKTGAPADGLVGAIGMCGDLLQRQGVARRPDDTDELSDGLRLSDR